MLPSNDLAAVSPILALVVISSTMLILDLFGKCCSRLPWLILACLSAWVLSLCQFNRADVAFHGTVFVDSFGAIFTSVILGGGLFTFLFNHEYLAKQRVRAGVDVDYLLVMAMCGAIMMVNAANLIVLFVGFELLSVCVYVLTGIARKERASAEGALKYFLLGAFSSAFLLYGMTLVYGATGTMSLTQIGLDAAGRSGNTMLLVGIGMLIFGFGFKVSLVPFHVWTPDVYQGAPVSISGFMAVVVKAAAFGSFLRVMYMCFGTLSETWVGLLWVLSALTMTVGNIVALRQKSIKRMLAYSSIAHAGYALIGFLAFGPAGGAEATVFYLVVYALMTVVSFGVVLIVTADTDKQYSNDTLQSLAGLGWSHPFLGLSMTIAMLSLAGMPPTAGFVGKLYLFNSAIQSGYVGLAIIAALNSVVSLYYYLRVLVVMYFGEHADLGWQPVTRLPWAPGIAIALCTFGTIYLGLFSQTCLPLIQAAFKSLG